MGGRELLLCQIKRDPPKELKFFGGLFCIAMGNFSKEQKASLWEEVKDMHFLLNSIANRRLPLALFHSRLSNLYQLTV